MQLVNLCYCFCMFVNKYLFHISRVRITCTKCCYNAKPSACYFCLKRKISVDFQICISVPLSSWNSTNKSKFNVHLIRQIKANNEWKKEGKFSKFFSTFVHEFQVNLIGSLQFKMMPAFCLKFHQLFRLTDWQQSLIIY